MSEIFNVNKKRSWLFESEQVSWLALMRGWRLSFVFFWHWMFALHQLVWYQIFCCVGRSSKIRGLVTSFFFSSSLVTQPLNFFYHEDAVVQTNDTKPREMNTWRQRKQHMPPSLPVEGMEKVFLCDNEERNTRFISGSPACQSHHIPKTVRGCISPNRLVSNIGAVSYTHLTLPTKLEV